MKNGELIQQAVTALGDTELSRQLAQLASTHACFANAEINEPIFTLRGQDRLSPKLVKRWAEKADKNGAPKQKVTGALDIAAQMNEWKPRRFPT